MKRKLLLFGLIAALALAGWSYYFFHSEEVVEKRIEANRPPERTYAHNDVSFEDFAEKEDGYWLFEPHMPQPDTAPVIVFIHGYSAYNPMVYGQWIRHLVQSGNIIIFPRYQENMVSTPPSEFVQNTVTAIKDALAKQAEEGRVHPKAHELIMVGHSFGGAIIGNLLATYDQFDLPECKGAMLVSAGTGPIEGFVLDSYASIPSYTKMLMMVSENDLVVGDVFAQKVFETAVNTPDRNLVRQFADEHGEETITASHLEVYELDATFDNGIHGYSYMRAQSSRLDQVDLMYWRMLDALIDCVRNGTSCELAFGNTPAQRSMGLWSDGTPVKELEILVP